MLSFRRIKISEIDFDNYLCRDNDNGSIYCGKRFYIYLYKPNNKFYLIRHLYNNFGSDEILISNQPININMIF